MRMVFLKYTSPLKFYSPFTESGRNWLSNSYYYFCWVKKQGSWQEAMCKQKVETPDLNDRHIYNLNNNKNKNVT